MCMEMEMVLSAEFYISTDHLDLSICSEFINAIVPGRPRHISVRICDRPLPDFCRIWVKKDIEKGDSFFWLVFNTDDNITFRGQDLTYLQKLILFRPSDKLLKVHNINMPYNVLVDGTREFFIKVIPHKNTRGCKNG